MDPQSGNFHQGKEEGRGWGVPLPEEGLLYSKTPGHLCNTCADAVQFPQGNLRLSMDVHSFNQLQNTLNNIGKYVPQVIHTYSTERVSECVNGSEVGVQ